jgi:hypothetical protein
MSDKKSSSSSSGGQGYTYSSSGTNSQVNFALEAVNIRSDKLTELPPRATIIVVETTVPTLRTPTPTTIPTSKSLTPPCLIFQFRRHLDLVLTFLNSDGSYYYSNPNGSTYYNSGSGHSKYTAPGK